MTNYSESDLIPKALEIIRESSDGIDMSSLIRKLREKINPSGSDTEILQNRSDDKFSQKVRNLKSHKTLEKKKLADFSKGKFYINQGGLDYLWDLNKNISDKQFHENKKKNNDNYEENKKIISLNILNKWPLSVRTFNVLKRENIIFLGDLITYNRNTLLKLKNFGQNSLNEINELYHKFNVNEDISSYDLSDWENIRSNLLIEEKRNQIDLRKNKNLIGVNKSIFKDFNNFKENYVTEEKILIDKNIKPSDIEKLIIGDIEYIISVLTPRMVFFFCGRYGYKENYKTLNELGKKFGITRERVRQLEKRLNLTLVKLGRLDKSSLINFFNKYEYVSFHKLFPKLDKLFTDTAKGTSEITRDKLVLFLENFCGLEEEYFKTPERELWHFDSAKLTEIFTFTPSAISKENFLEIIKDNFGYNNFVAKESIEYMKSKNLIKILDNKIYPIKLNKINEVANILASNPEGLHWKKICEIGNSSVTKNSWNLNRLVGDFSLGLKHNSYIYNSDRGTLKLLKFCNLIEDKENILKELLDIYNKNYKDQILLDALYKEIKKINKFKNINYYDLRVVVKIFGEDKGIYFNGKSSLDVISLNKNLGKITIKQKLIDFFNYENYEVNEAHLQNYLQLDGLNIRPRLEELVNEKKIFKLNPDTFINYNAAIKLCDKEEVTYKIEGLLSNHIFITNSFIRESLNDEFNYNFSIYYYDSLISIIATEKNWYHKKKFLSKNDFDLKNIENTLKSYFDMSLNINENFNKISKNVGISMLELMNLRKELNENYKLN